MVKADPWSFERVKFTENLQGCLNEHPEFWAMPLVFKKTDHGKQNLLCPRIVFSSLFISHRQK